MDFIFGGTSMQSHAFYDGSALITCMIVLVVTVALAVGMATMSGANFEIADHQRGANQAFANAESGLEVARYWIGQISIPSSTPMENYLSTAISNLQTELASQGVSNLTINGDGTIPTVVLDAPMNRTFCGRLCVDPTDPAVLRLTITGASREAARTICVGYRVEPYRFPIFDYGMATKGALQFPQNPTITGLADNWEADIYVESAGSNLAVQVGGNCNFDGDIDIGNPSAVVDFAGAVQIAGDYGQAAMTTTSPSGPIPSNSRSRRPQDSGRMPRAR